MGPEKKYEKRIKDELKRRGAWFVKFFANGCTKSGVPDILCCYCGRFLGIEVKGGGSYGLTELQKYNLQKIAEAGGIALCVYPKGWTKFLKALDSIAAGKTPEGCTGGSYAVYK